jgi:excisionase family DNA binding protein
MKMQLNVSAPRAALVDARGLITDLSGRENGWSIRYVRQLCATRKIPFYKLGGKVLFDLEQVRASLAAQPTAKAR